MSYQFHESTDRRDITRMYLLSADSQCNVAVSSGVMMNATEATFNKYKAIRRRADFLRKEFEKIPFCVV